jgi:RecA-family ATPase
MTALPTSEKITKLRGDAAAIPDNLILKMIGPRLPDFCRWCWPEGEVRSNFFYPAENLPDRISLTGDTVGTYWLQTGYRAGTIIDRLRADGLDPFDVWRGYLHSLPDTGAAGTLAEAVDARLGEMICPAVEWNCIAPPERRWIVRDWLPIGTVTSLYGSGGVGKTLIAQQLATCVATGRAFFGLETTQAPALVIACEDDRDELHRRQVSICATSGVEMHKLSLLSLAPRAGRQNILATFSNGIIQLMPLYQTIRETARNMGAKLIVIDNIAQCFAGNENIRAEVTAFVNALSGLALELDAAVLLLGHPGKASDSEYSGSTAWDAAVRSRWILERPKPDLDDGDVGELADLRVLRKAKANYAGTGDEIPIRWDKGAFRPEGRARIKDAVDRIEERLQEKADDAAFLACLDALREQGRGVSHHPTAKNYAPKAMMGKPEIKGISKRRLEQAMERLFAAGLIAADQVVGHKPNRVARVGIGRTEAAPMPAPAPAPMPEEGCTDAPAVCTDASAKSLKSLAPDCCTDAAPMRTEASTKSLESLAPMRTPLPPLYTTYIQGGTLGAVPPLEDTKAADELSRSHRNLIVAWTAGKLADPSEQSGQVEWLTR